MGEIAAGDTVRNRNGSENHRLNAMLRCVRKVVHLIATETDIPRLVDRACRMLVAERGYFHVWIALLDESNRVTQTVGAGLGATVLQDLRAFLSAGVLPPCAQAAAGRADPVVTFDPPSACAGCPLASHYAGRAGMTACLVHDEKRYGLMVASISPQYARDEQERSLFSELADDLAYSLFALRTKCEKENAEIIQERFLNLSSDLFCIVGLDGFFKYVNPAWEKTLGYPREELLSRPYLDFIHPEDHDRNTLEIARLARGEQTLNFENRYLTQSGSIRHLSWTATPLPREELLFCVGRDITEQKQLQANLVQADRMASVGLLAAGVAHEINNPLTYVLFNLEDLNATIPKMTRALNQCRNAALAAGHREIFEVLDELEKEISLHDLGAQVARANEGAWRIRDVVRYLGTFSRVDDSLAVPVSLNRIIEGALRIAFNEIKYRARLVKDFGDIPHIQVNAGKLSQVFLNLIVNAAHAIGDGALEQNEIRIKTWVDGAHVCASVQDTGCGIPARNQAHLFEPFFTTKEIGKGSGLGLYICHNIVHSMDGTIDVQSEEGKGTRFTLRLPITGIEEQPARPRQRAWGESLPEPCRGRLLLVDDEEPLRRVMGKMLGKEHEVVLAGSGQEAVKVLERDMAFDAIVCDLIMPRMTGMTLHQWLSERNPVLASHMIFMTGAAFTPEAARFVARVPNLKFEKPMDLSDLRDALRTLIQKSRNPTGLPGQSAD